MPRSVPSRWIAPKFFILVWTAWENAWTAWKVPLVDLGAPTAIFGEWLGVSWWVVRRPIKTRFWSPVSCKPREDHYIVLSPWKCPLFRNKSKINFHRIHPLTIWDLSPLFMYGPMKAPMRPFLAWWVSLKICNAPWSYNAEFFFSPKARYNF